MPDVVGIQFIKGGGVFYYRAPSERLALESLCVVESEHGIQMARVVRAQRALSEERAGGGMRTVLRAASPRDQDQYKKNERREQDAYRLCRQKVQEKALQMKLVDVNFTLDGRKAIFFFTAENRVDFRELVKELAHALKIKIEMRQIGVRDEARRLGGVGCCGRPLCCSTFLRDFSSVSIRMAKEQNLSLNPTKVSGLCGRLMCCLAYEYDGTLSKGKRKRHDGKSGDKGHGAKHGGKSQSGCGSCPEPCAPAEGVAVTETGRGVATPQASAPPRGANAPQAPASGSEQKTQQQGETASQPGASAPQAGTKPNTPAGASAPQGPGQFRRKHNKFRHKNPKRSH